MPPELPTPPPNLGNPPEAPPPQLPPNPAEPPKPMDDPIPDIDQPPGVEQPLAMDTMDTLKKPKETTDTRRNKRERAHPDRQVAQDRTAEYVVKALASIAVQLAIRTDRPEKQRNGIRAEEQHYLSRLWDRYTKQSLRVSHRLFGQSV